MASLKSRFLKKRSLAVLFGTVLLLVLIWPVKTPFADCYSTRVLDCHGRLLRVFLAPDQQFRFPPADRNLPEKYVTCLIQYEDRRFYWHPGVDPLALSGALRTNLRAGSRVRGGSTITMQVARLSHPKPRTVFNKIREIWTAVRLSLHVSKKRVLKLYASHVPMGGNIVGVEAASWHYFGKSWEELTWAEAALFVVLPNAPSRINLTRNRDRLLDKRNRLLEMLRDRGIMDNLTCRLACGEPLPGPDRRMPFDAPHFCETMHARFTANQLNTSLDMQIQLRAEDIVRPHHVLLKNLGVGNCSVLIAETQTGKIRAYVGSPDYTDSLNNGQVDGVQAVRSTGSLLKPFLVAKVLDRGPFTMKSVIQDVPTFYGTFAPMNASRKFSGLVTLEELLIHSLNVPSVRLLNLYGLEDFYDFLKQAGIEGLFRTASGYGLTLVLGGAETRLWDLVRLYLALGRMGEDVPLSCLDGPDAEKKQDRFFSQGASWLVLNTLNQLARPGSEYYWQHFNNQVPVAWKTGTSYGQKDGWAVGVNRQWTIGVWTGNFTGEGNASLSGARSAAPILFDLFNRLSDRGSALWFTEPEQDLISVACCAKSGYPVNPDCPDTVFLNRPLEAGYPGQCPYHRHMVIDRASKQSVCSLCWSGLDTVWIHPYIVNPAVRDILHRQGVPVDTIPSHASHCPLVHDKNRLEIVYPLPNIKIFIPRDIGGEHEKIVLSVKHQQHHAACFWFLNGRYVAETQSVHELAMDLDPGAWHLTVQDDEGFSRSVDFTVYKKGEHAEGINR
ncbi:penicillin-binding protein 1C [bacterium]|nr:penicillin-binding protein 1C [bacterium]